MIRWGMKSCKLILTKTEGKYQHYHQVKLINMNIFQGEEIVPPDQSREWKNLKLLIFPEENL